jgi:hypothetical protein
MKNWHTQLSTLHIHVKKNKRKRQNPPKNAVFKAKYMAVQFAVLVYQEQNLGVGGGRGYERKIKKNGEGVFT